jgi:hypothetical protein
MFGNNNVDRAEIERILTIAKDELLLTGVTGSGPNNPPIVNTANQIISVLSGKSGDWLSLESINEFQVTESENELLIYLEILAELGAIRRKENFFSVLGSWE